jgi:hypothetical protein
MAIIECENCRRRIGELEQKYEYDSHIVCAGCASTLSSASEAPDLSDVSDEVDVATSVAAAASAAYAHPAGAAARRPQPKKSATGTYIIAVCISLAMTALTVYLYRSGTIGPGASRAQRDEAAVVEEYNRLLIRANQSMVTRQNADAIAALESAQALASANPSLAKIADEAALRRQIDALRSGRATTPLLPPASVKSKEPDQTARGPKPPEVLEGSNLFGNRGQSSSERPALPNPPTPAVDPSPDPVPEVVQRPTRPIVNPTPAEPVPQPDVDLASEDVKGLLRTGWNKLAASDRDAATQFFTRAQKLKPASEEAAVAAAVLLATAGKNNEAIARLEAIAGRSKGLSRPTLALLLRETNPVRSILMLQTHLEQTQQLDEEALNLLGDGLIRAYNKDLKSTVLEKAEAFYQTYERKISVTRGSEARWGSQWMSRETADRKWSDFRKRASERVAADAELDDAENDLKRAQQKYADARNSVRKGNLGEFKQIVDDCQRRVGKARNRRSAAETAWKDVDKPVYDVDVNLVPFVMRRAPKVQSE